MEYYSITQPPLNVRECHLLWGWSEKRVRKRNRREAKKNQYNIFTFKGRTYTAGSAGLPYRQFSFLSPISRCFSPSSCFIFARVKKEERKGRFLFPTYMYEPRILLNIVWRMLWSLAMVNCDRNSSPFAKYENVCSPLSSTYNAIPDDDVEFDCEREQRVGARTSNSSFIDNRLRVYFFYIWMKKKNYIPLERFVFSLSSYSTSPPHCTTLLSFAVVAVVVARERYMFYQYWPQN